MNTEVDVGFGSDQRRTRSRRAERVRDPAGKLARLVDGAAAVFAGRGYHEATVHEICETADVSVGTFYEHFAGKPEVLTAVVRTRGVAFLSALTPETLSDRPRLEEFLQAFIDDPVTPSLWRTWREAALSDARLRASHAQLSGLAARALTRTIGAARSRARVLAPSVPARVVAWALIAFVNELVAAPEDLPQPRSARLAGIIHALVVGSTGATRKPKTRE